MQPLMMLAANRRARRIVGWGLLAGAVLVAAAVLGAMMLLTSLSTAVSDSASTAAASSCVPPAATEAAYSTWSAEQVTNAATIVRVGQADNVPEYGWIIAVATGMQESSLINMNYGDRDSLGVFQQRPSQGWGTAAQVQNVVYAAGQFYAHLTKVPGWQQMALTVAAQAVQNSGFPDAYAKWQNAATALVEHLAGGSGAGSPAAATQAVSDCQPGQVSQGTNAEVQAVLAWAYSAWGTSYVYGGSCTDPHSSDLSLHCDCSSLEQQAFLHGAGLQLPRIAQDQATWGEEGHGTVIPLSQAEPGDAVYFPTDEGPNTIGHTGIVVDPKTMTMIAAPHTGATVGYESYNPSNLAAVPYGMHDFVILRFINTGSSSGAAA